MIPKKTERYLEKAEAPFDIVKHKKVYTAFDAASTLKMDMADIAKNLLVRIGSKYAVAVLPASKNLSLDKLAAAAGAKKAAIASEKAMADNFRVKPGSLAAFGGAYKLPVYLDKALAGRKKGVFSTGAQTASVVMKLQDYKELEQPTVASFSVARLGRKPASKSKAAKPRK